jgi:hypothetical protein
MNITLKAALDAASIITCDGIYVTPGAAEAGMSVVDLVDQYDEDLIVTVVDQAQEIEVDSDGKAEALNVDGETVTFEFRITRPLRRADLPIPATPESAA